MPLFADIVLPLAQPAYSFSVPEGTEGDALRVGDAVAVQFGPRNIYTGIVWRLHDERPPVKRIKSVGRRLYDVPLLDEGQMRLWEWMADYYMCTLGEVMRVALPSLIKPQGISEEEFSRDEYRPRKELYLSLCEQWQQDEALYEECERISRRAPRRAELLREIKSLLERYAEHGKELPRRLVQCDATQIKNLQRAGYITLTERERSYIEPYAEPFIVPTLTPAQQQVVEQMEQSYAKGQMVHLLRGVTGSGKTEIYMTQIARVLAAGGDVLFLVPEIALTAQLIERLERIFSSRVTAYHSKLTSLRRTQTYMRLLHSGGGELVVGARSALFLPLRHLQLVIVDEEHDSGYKQSDTAPRYQGRDMAILLASLYGARTLLGSATPSLESYANAQWGKYGYSTLEERYGGAVPPRIVISDTIRSVKRGERRSHFNLELRNVVDSALERGEQVMLFQNRRGYSSYLQCGECGFSPRCPHCNVTLTLHRAHDRMECHYCGHTIAIPPLCPKCSKSSLQPMGMGTERVEQAAATLFAPATVLRLDRDTSTSERAYNHIVSEFESGKADILVGTQMIAKGFDFARVSVVGVLNADNLLFSPDFRSSERAFQLLTQVAGRAGRRATEGVVVVQTAEPQHPVIGWVMRGDYEAMARAELAERHAFGYPPYSRLVRLTLRDEQNSRLREGARELAELLRVKFGTRVAGPVSPLVDRIRGEYIAELLLKIEVGRSLSRARQLLCQALEQIRDHAEYKHIKVVVDVDIQ